MQIQFFIVDLAIFGIDRPPFDIKIFLKSTILMKKKLTFHSSFDVYIALLATCSNVNKSSVARGYFSDAFGASLSNLPTAGVCHQREGVSISNLPTVHATSV